MGDDADKFLWGLKNGELETVKECVEKEGKDVNTQYGTRCPLHYAADGGHKEVIQYLMQKGAEVNAKDKYEITPLLSAIYEGHPECAQVLLEHGAKPGKSPDGADYIDCAENDKIKEMLKQYKS